MNTFGEIKNFDKDLFELVMPKESYKINKYLLMCVWIVLSAFCSIEVRDGADVLNFYIKGIIILLWTYSCLSSSIYSFEENIFEKEIDCLNMKQEETLNTIKETFNMIFKYFMKYIVKMFVFCVVVHCVFCLILYSGINIKSFIYPSIIVFSFGLLPGGIYLIFEKSRYMKLSKTKRRGSIKVIILLIISYLVSAYSLEVFFKTEINYCGLEVITTSEKGYFNKRNQCYSWGQAEYFMPNVDDLPKYKDISYQCTITDVVSLCSEGLTLVVQYDEKTYREEKVELEDKYVFLEEELSRNMRYHIPKSRFSIGSYNFKVVKKFNERDSNFARDFGIIGTSDEKNSIAYLYFYDYELDSINEPMEDFVKTYFRYDF